MQSIDRSPSRVGALSIPLRKRVASHAANPAISDNRGANAGCTVSLAKGVLATTKGPIT